jgi:hypothetical protein
VGIRDSGSTWGWCTGRRIMNPRRVGRPRVRAVAPSGPRAVPVRGIRAVCGG